MASINNRSFNAVNVFHEQDQTSKTIDKVDENFYSKTEMTSVLAPINTATTALNTDMDAVESSLTTKLDKTGGTITGNINMNTNKIQSVGTPTANEDASNKKYVDDTLITANAYTDTQSGLKLDKTGGTITGNINMNTNKIQSVGTPTANEDASNKKYVDDALTTANTYTDTQNALKLDKTGGTISGTIQMDNALLNFSGNAGRIAGLADNPTYPNDAINRNYVDNLKVNPYVYTFETVTTNKALVTMNFTSNTASVRAFLGFKITYYSKALGFHSGDVNIMVAYYTIELERSLGIKQPTYFIGPKDSDTICVESKATSIWIYLKDNTADSTSERGSISIEFFKPTNCALGNCAINQNYGGAMPNVPINNSSTLATVAYVDATATAGGGSFLPLTGGTLSGTLDIDDDININGIIMNEFGFDMNGKKLGNCGEPTMGNQYTTKTYVDSKVATKSTFYVVGGATVFVGTVLLNKINTSLITLTPGKTYFCQFQVNFNSYVDVDTWASCQIQHPYGNSNVSSCVDSKAISQVFNRQHSFSFVFRLIVPSGATDTNFNIYGGMITRPGGQNPSQNVDIEYTGTVVEI